MVLLPPPIAARLLCFRVGLGGGRNVGCLYTLARHEFTIVLTSHTHTRAIRRLAEVSTHQWTRVEKDNRMRILRVSDCVSLPSICIWHAHLFLDICQLSASRECICMQLPLMDFFSGEQQHRRTRTLPGQRCTKFVCVRVCVRASLRGRRKRNPEEWLSVGQAERRGGLAA